jgi:hypothetical protein
VTAKYLLVGVALLLSSAAVNAASLVKFSYTGDADIQFILPKSPIPTLPLDNFGFRIDDVAVSFNGSDQVYFVWIQTPEAAFSGGFRLTTAFANHFMGTGEQLFTGTVSAPTFMPGTYQLTRFIDTLPGTGTLIISDVPEPDSWALMIAGFGLLGAVVRRRRALALA